MEETEDLSDDPVALLNLQAESAPAEGREGAWWIASLVSLVGFAGLGLLIALALPRVESDWFGARLLVSILGGTFLGALLSVVCGVVSFARNEKRAAWALLALVPSAIILLSSLGALLQEVSNRYSAGQVSRQQAGFSADIRADPEIVLREHWDRSSNHLHYSAFRDSFIDPQVHYTADMLRRIYDDTPGMRSFMFQYPACPPELLAAHFQEAYDLCQKHPESYLMLAGIVANPNTPIELVEKVAKAEQLPYGVIESAQHALKVRAQR